MSDLQCTCAARRPLGADHLSSCPMWELDPIDERVQGPPKVVQIFRDTTTGRPIAVPEDIVTEAEREYAAYKLHVQSKDWTTIAIALNYPSAAAASSLESPSGTGTARDWSSTTCSA